MSIEHEFLTGLNMKRIHLKQAREVPSIVTNEVSRDETECTAVCLETDLSKSLIFTDTKYI